MREIKFRGKALSDDHTTWLYGNLNVNDDGKAAIMRIGDFWSLQRVNPDTVGQFTGLYDAEGREIYEGDVVCIDDWSSPSYIRWDFVTASFVVDRWSMNLVHVGAIKIVGNVHDDPELLATRT